MKTDTSSATAVVVAVVAINNVDSIRSCVEPLSERPHVHTSVVDSASDDGCLRDLDDLPVDLIALDARVRSTYALALLLHHVLPRRVAGAS
jgi:hypothetical protein